MFFDITQLQFPDLPITRCQDDVLDALQNHQVLIVVGDTGCGKTTQLPKLCLKAGFGQAKLIGHTQPRRIAAKSVAARIAEELKQPLGQTVGFQVRFDAKVSENTQIKLMTDGILLNEIHEDKLLKRYEVIIIDEAHERSLNIDFLMGYLKCLLPKRPDLKLMITSATIQATTLAEYFKGATILTIPDRLYPINIQYRPFNLSIETDAHSQQLHFAKVVHNCLHHGAGDILVFLSSEQAIRELLEFSQNTFKQLECLPLYGRLPLSVQQKIFSPSKVRRMILATNIAETSLTVPRIEYVIDFGTARISRFNPRFKLQQLPIEKISKASASQRAGRCGRIAPGICYRLYDEDDFETRQAYTTPEIQRTNLAAVILKMKALGLGEILDFPFIDAPDSKYIRTGVRLLFELQAIDEREQITAIGKQLARFPIEPRLGRMLLAASRQGCLQEVLVVVSFLSTQDPRIRPLEEKAAADNKHKIFKDKHSDFSGMLNLWQRLQSEREISNTACRKFCEAHFLAYHHVRNWVALQQELYNTCQRLKLTFNQEPSDDQTITRSILQGLLGHVIKRNERGEYLAAHQKMCFLFPGSGVKKTGEWLVAGEFIETQKIYALHLAQIEGQWLSAQAKHVLTVRYGDPYYSEKQGNVLAKRHESLYGLVLPCKHNTPYYQVDAKLARRIFIEQAIIAGRWETTQSWRENLKVVKKKCEQLEHRLRRLALFDEIAAFEFYDKIFPQNCYSIKTFTEGWRHASSAEKNALNISLKDCLAHEYDENLEREFPESMEVKQQTIPLIYYYDASSEYDGATAILTKALAAQLSDDDFAHGVPGWLTEKIYLLLKGLPKHQRLKCHPLHSTAEKLAAEYDATISLFRYLSEQLVKHYHVQVAHYQWREMPLPEYLKIQYIIVEDGDAVAEVNLDNLLQYLVLPTLGEGREDERESLAQPSTQLDGGTQISNEGWTFGVLAPPEKQTQDCYYTGLQLQAGKVSEGEYITQALATTGHLQALCALYLSALQGEIKKFKKQYKVLNSIVMQLPNIDSAIDLHEAIARHIIYTYLKAQGEAVRDASSFQALFTMIQSDYFGIGQAISVSLQKTEVAYSEMKRVLDKKTQWLDARVAADIDMTLVDLFQKNFIGLTPLNMLQAYPRYLTAICHRIEKSLQAPERDIANLKEYEAWCITLSKLTMPAWGSEYFEAYVRMRYLLQEYRVSLFAQQLKAKEKVSLKKLKLAWDALTDYF